MDSNLKEILWPPNGLIFDQEFMLPAFCKPKLAPLKSAMDLEKMQKNALEKLKDLQAKEIEMNAEAEAVEKKESTNREADAQSSNSHPILTNIWKADGD